jgi:2-polyprenyl-3-methyl-5-hydroxy-6-metoxy-1,4-benzoquinol methylase
LGKKKKADHYPLKALLKNIIYQLRGAAWLDGFLFRMNRFRNRKANSIYRQQNSEIILPDDYDLYETYQLNYQKFIEDGKLAAKEIMEWTRPYLSAQWPILLDWGCGIGRITRHVKETDSSATVFACDIDEHKIRWNKTHYPDIDFSLISYSPPTHFTTGQFDMIYGISIFTHIDMGSQNEWLEELYRMLKPGGILLITTQGEMYRNRLSSAENRFLDKTGIYTQSYPKKGHRMMSTYHLSDHFKEMLYPYFIVKEFYAGKMHPEKMGGQDLWILQKK